VGLRIPRAHDGQQWKLCLRIWDAAGGREGWRIVFPARHLQGEEIFYLDLPMPETSSVKHHILAPPDFGH